ncbi:uncharacterized protein LOC123266828 [Cotesia glomerata]|uniref:uncharacterized protein LOC123266828 n=1 Tax=Cotesia glomerata TaxID=32391 RepID=UPI001D01D34F|nr:uncharacterized protein LOC123266828 [Cotesia glomerata]
MASSSGALYFFFFIESIMILEIIKLAQVWGDLAQTVTVLPTAIFAKTAQITASCNHLHINKVKNVLVLVKNFWESHLLDESEIEILKNDGIAHRAAMHSYCFLYYSQPVLYGITTLPPILLDIIVPLNETRERIFIFHDCYGLDSQKYSS